jgi:ribonuclease E
MPKIMLINVTHAEESRVGIISEGVLESFEIESLSREHLKGNIYKGVVHRIHPALEAAFVDIGAERHAFLPLDEICFRNLRNPPPPAAGNGGENGRKRRRIRDVLRPGEEILVQITKEQFANKPPTLTTFYSLPGRYLVLLPGSDDTGISRRIEGDDRSRLRRLVAELSPPDGFGLIVRTAAGVDEDSGELSRDLGYLLRLWENVRQAAESKRAPALVYREHDIVLRTIRDFFTPDIDEIHVDNEEVFQRARDFLHNVMPGKENVLHLYEGDRPIFSAFDVESQIESVFKRRVPLRSGGGIVIDGAEALTAIDVNSGGSVRGANPEETAFRTNREAVSEIARQLRLRDIGGLIVIDFIDMRDSAHIHEIEHSMRDAMHMDKARHEVGRISRLGLMEISRQRLRPAAMATTYTACPMCDGHGAIRTTESAALVALRKLHNRVSHGDVSALRVELPANVAVYLLNQKRDELARLEQRYNARIQVNLSEKLMPHQVEIEARQRPAVERPETEVAPGAAARVEAAATEHGAARAANGSPRKKRRRRGRRKGSGLRAAAAIGEALAAVGRTVLSVTGDAAPATEDAASPARELDASPPLDTISNGRTPDTPAVEQQPASRGRTSSRRRRGGRRRSAELRVAIAAGRDVPAVARESVAGTPPAETSGAPSPPFASPAPAESGAAQAPAPTADEAVAARVETGAESEAPRRRRAGTTGRHRARKSTPAAEATSGETPQAEPAPRRRTPRKTTTAAAKGGAGKGAARPVKAKAASASRKTSPATSRRRAPSGTSKRKKQAAAPILAE